MEQQGTRLLVADADLDLTRLFSLWLPSQGYEVLAEHNGERTIKTWRQVQPAIVILDLWLPLGDGFDVLHQMRAESTAFIFVLATPHDEEDEVHALEVGADRFLVKPFHPRILLAWLRYACRKAATQRSVQMPGVLASGDFWFDIHRGHVAVAGKMIQLRKTESRLLYQLFQHSGGVAPKQVLIDRLWGHETGRNGLRDRENMQQVIRRLRHKLEPDPKHPRYIVTIGEGYVFQPDGVSKQIA